MNIFTVTTEIREILMRSETIQELVGEKIFPIVAPENTEGDFICYQRDGYKQTISKMGVAQQSPQIYINIVSEDYDRTIQIAAAVREELEGEYQNPYMRIEMEDSSEDYEQDKFIQVLLFTISI